MADERGADSGRGAQRNAELGRQARDALDVLRDVQGHEDLVRAVQLRGGARLMETRALRRVFGAHADAVPVSSTKSMIGHLIGASAAVGLIATVLTLHDGIAHPTINYETPDPECDLDCVPNRARPVSATVALANAFAFGGSCVSIAVRRGADA